MAGKVISVDQMEECLSTLVTQMGFSRQEAQMALEDCQGDMSSAIERIVAGRYAPPAYNEVSSASGIYPNLNSSYSKEAPSYHEPSAPMMDFTFAETGGVSPAPDINSIIGLPPPYEVLDKDEKVKLWEKDSGVIFMDKSEKSGPSMEALFASMKNDDDARCSICYSLFFSRGSLYSEDSMKEIIQQDNKFYHYQCFSRKFSPRCSYCCFPLTIPDKDRDLSGRYLKYEDRDYHVECYERYAGPRCTYCCNVIIQRPNGEFSGSWVKDDIDRTEKVHVECVQKKLQVKQRAKKV